MLAELRDELVVAARLPRKSPGFTVVATISLALAIGANTTIFSTAKQLLFARLDIPDAAGLRLLTATDASFCYPVYEQLRARTTECSATCSRSTPPRQTTLVTPASRAATG